MDNMNEYPQLFDRINLKGLKGKGEYGEMYDKHKAGELSGLAKQKDEALGEQVQYVMKKYQKPILFGMFAWLPFVIVFVGVITSLPDVGFSTAYGNAPGLFWALIPLLVLAVIGTVLLVRARKKQTMALAEIWQADNGQVDRLIREHFNIPENTLFVACIQKFYRAGKQKPLKANTALMSFAAYADHDSVYFYQDQTLLKIPKRECLVAEMAQGKVVFTDHTLSIDVKSPECKQYGIKKANDNSGLRYVMPCCGRLMFQSGGITWTLDVLPQCLDELKKLFAKE